MYIHTTQYIALTWRHHYLWLMCTMMLFEQITSRKLRLLGDVMRHDGLEKTVIQGKVEGKWGRGRTGRAWHSDIEEWVGYKLHQASQLAEHRDRWRTSMKATAARLSANWYRERENVHNTYAYPKCTKFVPNVHNEDTLSIWATNLGHSTPLIGGSNYIFEVPNGLFLFKKSLLLFLLI